MTSSGQNKIAVLVHTCDRYELLYRGFEFFFNENWKDPGGCSYYFATEEKQVSIKGFTNIRSGKGQWSDRLKTLLLSIPEDYILYFQEDMWLSKPTNAEFFRQLFDMAIAQKFPLVKLHSAGVYQTIPGEHYIEGFNIARLQNETSRYQMSHQVSLWQKEILLAQLKKDEHPWRNERRGSKRMKKLNLDIMHVDYFAENVHPPINDNRDIKGRSAYYSISRNASLLPNAQYFIDEMLQGDVAAQAYAQKLAYNLQHGLTHDGLPRPKKTDIFKKIKNLLLNR